MPNDTEPTTTPSPEPTAAPVAPATTTPVTNMQPGMPRKKKTGIIVAIVVAVLAVLLAVGAVLAYNLWYQNPSKVVHDAVIHAVQAKTATAHGTITVSAKDAEIALTFDTKSNTTEGAMSVKADISVPSGSSQMKLSVNGEAVVAKDGAFYFKLSDVQKTIDQLAESMGTEVPKGFNKVIDRIDNQWVSVSPSDYETASKEASDMQACFTKVMNDVGEKDAMRNEVVDLYKKHQLLVVDESLGSKDINGVGSLGYEVSFDQQAASDFAKGLKDTEFGQRIKKCDDSVDFDKIAKEIADETKADTNKADTATSKLTVWVSRFGHDFTQIALTASNDDTNVISSIDPVFNKDVKIEIPKDAVKLKNLLEDIQTAYEDYMTEQYAAYGYTDHYADSELDMDNF